MTCQKGGALRIFGAGKAGRVDALVENHHRAADALAAFGDDAGIVGGLDAQRVQEPVGKIVGHIKVVGIDTVAVRADQLDIAKRHHPASLLIVLDLLRDHFIAAIVDLHAADRRHQIGVTVIDQFIGRKQELGSFRNVLPDILSGRVGLAVGGWDTAEIGT